MYKIYFLVLTFILVNCNQTENDNRMYYFQFSNFLEAKIYTYSNSQNENDKIYFSILSRQEKKNSFLYIEKFDSNLQKYETLQLDVNNSGIFVKDFHRLIDTNLTRLKVYSDTLFFWNNKKNDKYLFESSVNRPEMRNLCVYKIITKYKGQTSDFNYNDSLYKAIISEEDLFYDDGTGKIFLQKSKITYAENLGIVSIEISNDFGTKKYVLKSIEAINKWEEKIKKNWSINK